MWQISGLQHLTWNRPVCVFPPEGERTTWKAVLSRNTSLQFNQGRLICQPRASQGPNDFWDSRGQIPGKPQAALVFVEVIMGN